MKKDKKVIIYVSAITLLASGVKFTICKGRNINYLNYINHLANASINDDTLISAHRGFSSLAVENTGQAIMLASKEKYIDYIEIDARLTKDGKIVLSHDNELKTNNDKVIISNYSYNEAMNTIFIYHKIGDKVNLWDNSEKIIINERKNKLNNQEYYLIDLKEALCLCQGKKILLDLKFNNDIQLFTEILKSELENIDTSNIIFQSLNISGIKYLKDNSNFDCQVLISNYNDLNLYSDFDRVGLNYHLVSYELIDYLVKQNKKIALWTINDVNDLEKVLTLLGEYYKDIIYITDYPDLIAAKLHQKILKK